MPFERLLSESLPSACLPSESECRLNRTQRSLREDARLTSCAHVACPRLLLLSPRPGLPTLCRCLRRSGFFASCLTVLALSYGLASLESAQDLPARVSWTRSLCSSRCLIRFCVVLLKLFREVRDLGRGGSPARWRRRHACTAVRARNLDPNAVRVIEAVVTPLGLRISKCWIRFC